MGSVLKRIDTMAFPPREEITPQLIEIKFIHLCIEITKIDFVSLKADHKISMIRQALSYFFMNKRLSGLPEFYSFKPALIKSFYLIKRRDRLLQDVLGWFGLMLYAFYSFEDGEVCMNVYYASSRTGRDFGNCYLRTIPQRIKNSALQKEILPTLKNSILILKNAAVDPRLRLPVLYVIEELLSEPKISCDEEHRREITDLLFMIQSLWKPLGSNKSTEYLNQVLNSFASGSPVK